MGFLPAASLALLLLFALLPFYWVFITAFKTELQITRWVDVLWPRPWSLEQFRTLLGPMRSYMVWLRNTLIVSSITAVIATLVAALSAYALTRLRWRGATAFADFLLVSYLMPGVMVLMPIYQLITKLGLNNSLLSLIIYYPTLSLPFATWMMMSNYTSIPAELEAAAMVDGCDRFQTFFKVILPLSRPALMSRRWSSLLLTQRTTFTLFGRRTEPESLSTRTEQVTIKSG